ncbi:Putative ATP-dependent RNA helicase ucp12 [Wickerhamiella sorbophila]|uniref:ATP-dependent RNA helicase ucp12 n=1 Tax=Wickerhamiella sorbophila TaxID=45607 RepID=A0A2T0FN08_9ASCO|nr:Putative ATP-dependent RNA helicase ucp12 [Wickerhamiella sorbophila]PRT56357.1 Putative ATP-dependent RNA helicase ucp12 [Wickerhamiella sorbophila]
MKEVHKKSGKKKDKIPEPKEVELTPKQLKEKRREEARARAAESRKIVAAGVVSWTGKLPAQLLNEYCQKLKWERVEYPIKGSNDSHVASVIVARRNPKTNQVEKIRFDPPKDLVQPQPTPLEARHLAATYGLHRISSHKNWKMMLPPMHRDLWVQFDQIKSQAPEKDKWKWSEDPFQAEEERKMATQRYKEQREQSRESEKEKVLLNAIKKVTLQETKVDSPEKPSKRTNFNSTLNMSRPMRELVEITIRENGGFQFSSAHALDPELPIYKEICSTIGKLGFNKSQIEEALEYSNTLSRALAWLLIHVPEDDLPKLFRPTTLGTTARISAAMNVENAVSKIRQFGFSEDIARDAMARIGGSMSQAMVYLTHQLIERVPIEKESEDIWAEEIQSVEAVFGDHFKELDGKSCKLDLDGGLTIYFYKPVAYPDNIPGIGITANSESIPKYVVLDAIKRAAQYAEQLVGDFMILSIANWIADNFDEIKANPCKLAQISSGVSGTIELPSVVKDKKSTKARSSYRWRPLDSSRLLKEHETRFAGEKGTKLLASRQSLPAWSKKKEILEVVTSNQVTLITGETGSGKSTQVVQFILDQMIASKTGGTAHIVCTQPRRISAIGVAQRVADERLVEVGSQVGYIIRGETKISSDTQLKFVTSGVLLRMIQSDPKMLESFSHIVVDEVHERSLDSDFLLILLKRICARNKKLKVVLMSATVDPALFINYFKPVSGTVGYTHIEGRTFPVQKYYLDEAIRQTDYVPFDLAEDGVKPDEIGRIITSMRDGLDYNLIATLVAYIHQVVLGQKEGSILIFMSGVAEIERVVRAIEKEVRNTWVLPLHASLSPADQRLVFRSPPAGKRKIIVCTNIAETSITIADAVAVVDSGRVKETVYDPSSSVIKLVDNWTSQASTTQRMGRAGRVQAGVCYKLFTAQIESEKMIPRPTPEILRAPLESLYLSIKAMKINDVEKFLGGALDSPNASALKEARDNLLRYGAISYEDSALTPLGQHMALIPADPKIAKLLVLSTIFGCLPMGLTVASIVTGKPPFVTPREKRESAKTAQQQFNTEGNGDLTASVLAYESWLSNQRSMSRGELKNWCTENYVSNQACRDIYSSRRQFLSNLVQTGFIDTDREDRLPEEYRAHDGNLKLIRALVGAAFTPNIAEIVFPEKVFKTVSAGTIEADHAAQKIRYFTPTGERVFIHPGSLLFGVNKFVDEASFLSYTSSIVSSKYFISTLTPLSIYGLIFFSNLIEVDPLGAGVIVDGWTGLKCWPRVGLLVQFLKQKFSELLMRKFANPHLNISSHPVMTVVHELIESDGKGKF